MIEWLIIGGGATAVGWYVNYQKEQKSKKEKEEILTAFEQLWPDVKKLTDDFEKKISFNSGYFNFSKWGKWKEASNSLQKKVLGLHMEKVILDPSRQTVLKNFHEYTQSPDKFRTDFNKRFIVKELADNQEFFNSIEGKSLDSQQREAVVIDEDHNLVIAGAGSGKTLTIAAKVAYLINRWKVKPEEILLISFTRKSSSEMQERIEKRMGLNVKAMTFHKLGIEIISEVENEKPSIFDDGKLSELFNDLIKEEMKSPEYMELLTKYFIQYLKPLKPANSFDSRGAYIQYMKDGNIKGLKTIEKTINGRKTFLRETCKSYDEVSIANFLFINNIEYIYEHPYEHKTANNQYQQYRPDFYLPGYGIYIEHFGVDKAGKVPDWFTGTENQNPTEKYQSDMTWKRELHKTHKTKLVETYSYESWDGTLFKSLESRLKILGVRFEPKSTAEIWETITKVAKDEVLGFNQLVQTFISLLKSNNYILAEIKSKNKVDCSGFNQIRNSIFIDLCSPILAGYENALKADSSIDFNDMINVATSYVRKGKSKFKFKYIVIDEFQDISIGRYQLIKSILERNSGCKLFCVGDDWQSIYRFSGSDIAIFTEFQNYFGATHFSKIETTYRFNSQLIETSSRFILKNTNQLKKELKSKIMNQVQPISILQSEGNFEINNDALLSAIQQINDELKTNSATGKVLALGRYGHDIENIKKDPANFKVVWNQGSGSFSVSAHAFPEIVIEFLTVHRAKGLEADFVILLNCNSGKYGFPSEQADDPILNLLLTQADQFENGEERRLFYVALTRCRQKVFLIAKSQYPSKFIKEIESSSTTIQEPKCPICKTGAIQEFSGISKAGNPYTRLTCSNWSWGCEYLAWA